MDYKNIVVGGMGLAGSTLCFNICKNISIIEKKSHRVYLGSALKYTENNGGDMINLYKAHVFNPKFKGNDSFNIFVIRDIRDCVSSMLRKTPEKWTNNILGACDYNMSLYNTWKNERFNTYFKYEDYKENPFEYVKNIITLMDKKLSDKEIKMVIELSENVINNDNITDNQNGDGWNKYLITKKHSTNSGKIGDYNSNLSKTEIKAIETKYKWFFEKHNYKLK